MNAIKLLIYQPDANYHTPTANLASTAVHKV